MQKVRNLVVWLSQALPTKMLRRLMVNVCYMLPPIKPEDGAFRTDVAQCVVNVFRRGDLDLMESWLARYPFPNRWNEYLKPRYLAIFNTHLNRWRLQDNEDSTIDAVYSHITGD